MNQNLFLQSLTFLRFQRNIFAALGLILAVGITVLSCFLFSKHERILVVPPVVEKEFWVESKSVSPSYLEQFGCFLGQLLLGKSSQSAPHQRHLLLLHTSPDFSGTLRKKLLDEEELLKQQNASYVFYPNSVEVHPENLEVLLKGDRIFFIGGNRISEENEGYLLSFTYRGGRLLLQEVKASGMRAAGGKNV